jgi:hypothetical protein
MCYPVSCRACGKTGWDGCGQHVDEVMKTVPASERCICRTDVANAVSTVGENPRRLAHLGTRSRR